MVNIFTAVLHSHGLAYKVPPVHGAEHLSVLRVRHRTVLYTLVT